jgi:hypothetical protein
MDRFIFTDRTVQALVGTVIFLSLVLPLKRTQDRLLPRLLASMLLLGHLLVSLAQFSSDTSQHRPSLSLCKSFYGAIQNPPYQAGAADGFWLQLLSRL